MTRSYLVGRAAHFTPLLAGVRELDQHLAELRESLEEMVLWNDAYVIVTAGHGKELYEHDRWGTRREGVSAAQGSLRRCWRIRPAPGSGALLLYDVTRDPTEPNELSSQRPERFRSMKRLLEEQVALQSGRAAAEPSHVAISGEETERLRALGYVE